MIDKKKVKTVFGSKYVNLYEMEPMENHKYYIASRKDPDHFTAVLPDEEAHLMLPDAVSIFCVIRVKGQEPMLLLNWEFRYPVGQYMLSVPAGLIDKEDMDSPTALVDTTIRELREETGIEVGETDEVRVVSPGVFSTPGLTDESNALMLVSINRDEMPDINFDNIEGTEQFEGYRLVSKAEAQQYLADGRDEHGNYYPLFTWAALIYFLHHEL